MSVSTPLEIAQIYMVAVTGGDLSTAVSTFAPDIVWCQPGNNHFSGVHRGPEAIGRMIGTMITESEETFRLTMNGTPMVNGSWVAFPVHFVGQKNGRTLNMNGVDLVRVEGGKIVEVRLFSANQLEEDAFWG